MRRLRFIVLPCVLTVVCAAGFGAFSTAASAQDAGAPQEPLIDERIGGTELELLSSAVGYAIPEFDDDVQWLGRERPDFASLRGRVVVLNTWDSKTTNGRNMSRRVTTLLRKFGDDVRQIALHTPEGAGTVVAKYARHSGSLPVPTAIDTAGAYLDELGIYRDPRIIVIDRDGRIAHAGVSLAQLRDAVQRTLDIEMTAAVMPEDLPSRAERIDEEVVDADTEPEWPAHSRIQAGFANNLQGKRGPGLRVGTYLNGEAPDTAGKVVMIEFWATWCGPCIGGIPHLNELQAEFEGDLVIVGISAEAESLVRSKMQTDRRLKFEYLVGVDPRRTVQGAVGNRGIPHCIVMSSDGIVRWQGDPRQLSKGVMQRIVEANRIVSGGPGAGSRWVTPG